MLSTLVFQSRIVPVKDVSQSIHCWKRNADSSSSQILTHRRGSALENLVTALILVNDLALYYNMQETYDDIP